MSFTLQRDRIAVVAEELETKTAGGLHIPEGAVDYHEPRFGIVAHVGIGRRNDLTGELIPIDVQVGDRVFFHKASGETWQFEGVEYVLLGPGEIIGVESP